MPGQKTCEICKEEAHKYKCPCCLIKYCSVSCFKSHKEKGCTKKESTQNKPVVVNRPVTALTERVHLEDGELSKSDGEVTEDTVPKALLQKLNQNPELLAHLQNPHLRNLLVNVDSSRSTATAIHQAMQEPLFTEFADTCLNIVEADRCDTKLKILQDQCY